MSTFTKMPNLLSHRHYYCFVIFFHSSHMEISSFFKQQYADNAEVVVEFSCMIMRSINIFKHFIKTHLCL